MMKKLLLSIAACLPLMGMSGEKIIVGASPTPHAEILEQIKPVLAKQGVDLEVRVFTDFIQPNAQLAEKRIDANFFQHEPFMREFNRTRGTDIVKVSDIFIAPFGAYSRKIKNINELRENALVAIPNDAVNAGRALQLLHQAGVIQLSDPANSMATERNIVANPKKVVIKQFEAPMLPRTLSEVDLSVINTTYALEAKLTPAQDALFLEGDKSLFINMLAARPDNKDSEAMQKLTQALRSAEVRDFINTRFKGSLSPVF